MTQRIFKSPEDFRNSLEARLSAQSRRLNQDLERIRRKVAFERLLARLFISNPHIWLLKGGYAMELRFHIARATKDIDLMLRGFSQIAHHPSQQEQLRELLAEAASYSLPDFFHFRVSEAKKDLEGPPYGGTRFLIESQIGGRRFVRFNLDLALGDLSLEPINHLRVDGWLSEYGLPPIDYYMISAEQQFAEKLHAYTRPMENRVNTRVKDLIDMILLIESGDIDKKQLKDTINKVFKRRNTHPPPEVIISPPFEWKERFEVLAIECKIGLSMEEGFQKLSQFLKSQEAYVTP